MHYPEATNLQHGTAILYQASHNFSAAVASRRGQPVSGQHADYQVEATPFRPLIAMLTIPTFRPGFHPLL